MQIGPFALARLAIALALAGDDELVVLDDDGELVGGKAGDGQADAQPALAGLLDVVGRIAFGGGLGGALDEQPCAVETEQERTVEKQRAVHLEALLEATSSRLRPRMGAGPR